MPRPETKFKSLLIKNLFLSLLIHLALLINLKTNTTGPAKLAFQPYFEDVNIFSPNFVSNPDSTTNIIPPKETSAEAAQEHGIPHPAHMEPSQLNQTLKFDPSLKPLIKSPFNVPWKPKENPVASNSPIVESLKDGEIIVSEHHSSPFFDFLVRVARRVFFATISQLSSNPVLIQDTFFSATVLVKQTPWETLDTVTPNAISAILSNIIKTHAEDPNPPALLFERSFKPKIDFHFEIKKHPNNGFKIILRSELKL